MKHIQQAALVLAAAAVLALASCTFIDADLVGDWGYSVLNVNVTVISFESDGTMTWLGNSYKYSAISSTITYWTEAAPDTKITMDYLISDDTLTLVTDNGTISYNRL